MSVHPDDTGIPLESGHPQAPLHTPIDDVLWPLLRSAAVIAAGRLGIFESLGRGERTLGELAGDTGCSETGLHELLAVLVANGYVTGTGDRYRNAPPARSWLTSDSTIDFTPALLWGEEFAQVVLDLPDVVRNGAPSRPVWQRMAQRPQVGVEFAGFMRAKSLLTVNEIVDAVPLDADLHGRMLDLGGSHGLHTTAFCTRYPGLRSTILDLPQSLVTTPAAIADAGLTDRVEVRPGDYLNDEIGHGYDVVLCFEILHVHGEDDCTKLLDKISDALRPGGIVIILEEVREHATEPQNAAFSLAMFACTGARTYTFEEMQKWLSERGFTDVRQMNLTSGSTSLITATKSPVTPG